MLHIGIDTGVHTGFAVWNSRTKEFEEVTSLPIHEALRRVFEEFASLTEVNVHFEDARQRRWYDTHTAAKDRARLQGAGSIKRDCTIWEDALTDWGVPFEAVPPRRNMTKLSAEQFRRITGWQGKTNEHSRDAAMLVFQR